MTKVQLASGVAHTIPKDLKAALVSTPETVQAWQDITPLARNEWICWVENAKLTDTRKRRIARTANQLNQGKRRPCCWAGCQHRAKNGS